jgi:hypothetical protein
LNECSGQDLKWCGNILLDEDLNQAQVSTVIQATCSRLWNSQSSRDRRVRLSVFFLSLNMGLHFVNVLLMESVLKSLHYTPLEFFLHF